MYYVTQAPIELGVANIVTGILITYRGFDTLGEVAVLFMVAASVGILLDTGQAPVADVEIAPSRRAPSEIVATSRQVLLPLILAFGAYVIVNGHLSAGGGFQGGAIVASGLMLQLLARPNTRINLGVLSVTESLAGILYVSLGILGMVFAGGFLDGAIPAAGRIWRVHKRRRDSLDLGLARHQGWRRTQCHRRPVPELAWP